MHYIYGIFILIGIVITFVSMLFILNHFNKLIAEKHKHLLAKAELNFKIDLKKKIIFQTGTYLDKNRRLKNIEIITTIKEVLKGKNHKILSKNFIDLLEQIDEDKIIFSKISKLFSFYNNNFIFYLIKNETGSIFSSIYLTSFNNKTKQINGISNVLISNSDNLFSFKDINLKITDDTKLVSTLLILSKKMNKEKIGIIKISADITTRIHTVTSTGLFVQFSAFVDYLNAINNLKAVQSNLTSLYVLVNPKDIKNVRLETKNESNKIRDYFTEFSKNFLYSKDNSWLKIEYEVIEEKKMKNFENALSKIYFLEEKDNYQYNENKKEKLTSIKKLDNLVDEVSKEIRTHTFNILEEEKILSNNEKITFLVPELLLYQYNLIIEKTANFKHIFIEYIMGKVIKIAENNLKNNYVITLHFSLIRHLLEKEYKIPKNLIINFSIENIKDGLFYDQLLNLRNMKVNLTNSFAVTLDEVIPIFIEIVSYLEPKYIFVPEKINKERKWNFDVEFIYAQLYSYTKNSDVSNMYVLI